MASLLKSALVGTGLAARVTHTGVITRIATYEFLTGTPNVVNDVIQMVPVPIGATVLNVELACNILGASTILAVGDGDQVDRFIKGSDVSILGGTARLGAGQTAATQLTAYGYKYAADDTIDVKVTTASTASGLGKIQLTVQYTMDA